MNPELEKRIDRHDYEIESLKTGISSATEAMLKVSESVDKLTNSFASYTVRHDNLDKSLAEIKLNQLELTRTLVLHGQDIAAIKPVAEALRGIVWRIATSVLVAGGGVVAIIASMPK